MAETAAQAKAANELKLRRRPGFIFIYGLLYVLFLGDAILSILNNPPNLTIDLSGPAPWAALFATYFALQFVQAVEDLSKTSWRLLADLFELYFMICLFVLLGFEGPQWLVVGVPLEGYMVAALSVPPAYRILDHILPHCQPWSLTDLGLTALSLMAVSAVIASSEFGLPEGWAALVVGGCLFLYACFFVFTDFARRRLAKAARAFWDAMKQSLANLLEKVKDLLRRLGPSLPMV